MYKRVRKKNISIFRNYFKYEGEVKSSQPNPYMAIPQMKLPFCYVYLLNVKVNSRFKCDHSNRMLYTAV